METQWTARQLRALEPEATVEERLSFDAGIISLLGRSTTEGLCTVVWCDSGKEAADLATLLGYLEERFQASEAGDLRTFAAAGVSGWPRTLLSRAIGLWERMEREAGEVTAMRQEAERRGLFVPTHRFLPGDSEPVPFCLVGREGFTAADWANGWHGSFKLCGHHGDGEAMYWTYLGDYLSIQDEERVEAL